MRVEARLYKQKVEANPEPRDTSDVSMKSRDNEGELMKFGPVMPQVRLQD